MSREGLNSPAGPNIPQLGEGIAGARDKDILISRVDADAHDIPQMVGEFSDPRAGLDIPQHTSHISRGGQDATIIDESAA